MRLLLCHVQWLEKGSKAFQPTYLYTIWRRWQQLLLVVGYNTILLNGLLTSSSQEMEENSLGSPAYSVSRCQSPEPHFMLRRGNPVRIRKPTSSIAQGAVMPERSLLRMVFTRTRVVHATSLVYLLFSRSFFGSDQPKGPESSSKALFRVKFHLVAFTACWLILCARNHFWNFIFCSLCPESLKVILRNLKGFKRNM
ncbi:uncharacterized protein LOC129286902 isoform X2 [Prosopis cineraria]|uniref:uncharacterized protein LOC129286902 isoform X2 n=1 Tax=Prosopis cineraria TaxID=364024 RepID=UPI00240F60C6|nr:uncharacterized protein LOC129286902 isoform X2 [Prosopis cineraria]